MDTLGTLEREVMECIWRQAPVTARDVCQRLTGRKARAYTTIMTTMDRLHRKGLLLREKDGLAWRYSPALDRAAFERAQADHLAADIVQGHGDVGLAAFVDAAANDARLLDRLAKLIAARRRQVKK